MEKRSARYKDVRHWYLKGWWSRERVIKAVKCGWITEAEMDEILEEGTKHE